MTHGSSVRHVIDCATQPGNHWYPGSGVVSVPDLCILTYFLTLGQLL